MTEEDSEEVQAVITELEQRLDAEGTKLRNGIMYWRELLATRTAALRVRAERAEQERNEWQQLAIRARLLLEDVDLNESVQAWKESIDARVREL